MADQSTGREPRFLGSPTSRLGWTSVWVFLASVVLASLNTLVIQPVTESRPGLDTPQMIYNVITGLTMLTAGGMGLVALIRSHERSWAVILPVVIMIAALALMVMDLASG